MELNHIFLFIAVVSPLAVLARAWRPGGPYRGWRLAAFVVLVITGIAWIFFRKQAGYIGGGAWLALLFLPAIGLRRVAELAALQRYESARKLAEALQLLHPSSQLREQVQLFRTLESRQSAGVSPMPHFQPHEMAQDRHRRLRSAPAVLVIISLNVVAFLFEVSRGAWTEPMALHRLGALEPYAVTVNGEYWRLFTALFLHYDVVHLLFNLFALYVLGPPLERAIGAVRFCACYLIAGIGSSAGVVMLTLVGVIHPARLVGASGCVMGIVGAWAGFLLRHRYVPLAKQRLRNVAMIVVIQIVFDLSTPQVSMAAHLCGLFTGFAVGLAIAPKSKMSI
ncbi:MAG: rhomboid family intramembrane serine protease [Verrucomicrobiota bacterium]|nr:rhomboid family intramembrane serine protease [Verrucomicrobiota bacterium]